MLELNLMPRIPSTSAILSSYDVNSLLCISLEESVATSSQTASHNYVLRERRTLRIGVARLPGWNI